MVAWSLLRHEMLYVYLATCHQSKEHLLMVGLLPPSSDLNTVGMNQELTFKTNMKFDWMFD